MEPPDYETILKVIKKRKEEERKEKD